MSAFEYLIKVREQIIGRWHPCLMFPPGGGLVTPHNSIQDPSDLFSFSHVRNAARMEDSRLGALRSFSSSPQGIRATVSEQVGRWQSGALHQIEGAINNSPDNPDKEAGVGPHPRIGIGLPMSNIFATYGLAYTSLSLIVQSVSCLTRYFGGSLSLVSLNGWGLFYFLIFSGPNLTLVRNRCLCAVTETGECPMSDYRSDEFTPS